MNKPVNVLVLERDPAFKTLYLEYLQDEWNWELDFADTREQAEELLKSGRHRVCFIRTDRPEADFATLGREMKELNPSIVLVGVAPIEAQSSLDNHMADLNFNMKFLPASMRLLQRKIWHHLNRSSAEIRYRFKLYYANDSELEPILTAIEQALTKAGLLDSYTIDVFEIHFQPEAAEQANITATPVLIRENPLPRMRFIGDFAKDGSGSKLVL